MGAEKMRVVDLFERLDKNGSGFISPDDLAFLARSSGSQPTPLALMTMRLVQGFIQHSDANKDRKVSKDEMLTYVDKTMADTTPETLPDYVRGFVSTVFALMDTDKSGKVNRAAFEEYLKAHDDAHAEVVSYEFEQLDRDHDGFLTPDDLQAAAHAFFTAPDRAPQHWLLAAVPYRTAQDATA
ncbi:EF-hand domain-containing protein [Streptomyces sp. NPDC088727]|uniref:EF-hand domain-containing protein n=1 Tax=Streptomyces sp. NPDC088727 TaxID=3365875 RepID=UPI00381D10D9